MANPEHVEIVRAGRIAISKWVEKQPIIDEYHCLDLSGITLSNCRLTGADLRYVNLNNAKLELVCLNGADLRFAKLNGTIIEKSELIHAKCRCAIFKNAGLERADLRNSDFRYAVLEDVYVNKVSFRGSNFSRAILKYVECHKANFIETNFNAAYLQNCKLNDVRFKRAQFPKARLIEVELRNDDLKEVNLKYSDNYKTDFTNSNCTKAQFQHARLNSTRLLNTKLRKTNLSGVFLYATLTDEWDIDDVTCTYFFIGYYDGKNLRRKRIPTEGFLLHKEFEGRFKSRPTIEFIFENGIPALGPVVLDRAITQANERKPKYKLRLLDITSRGDLPRAIIEVAERVSKEDALMLVGICYKQKFKQMQKEIEGLKNDKKSLFQIASQKMLLPALGSKNAYMSYNELAELYQVEPEALRKRLERRKAKYPLDTDFFVESENKGVRKPSYLYNTKMVIPIVESIKKKRPSNVHQEESV